MKRLALFAVVVALPAFAADAPVAAPSWASQLLSEAIAVLVPLLGSALFGLLVAGIRWAAAHAAGTRFEHATDVLDAAVEGAVGRIKAKLLAKFADATAAGSDGGVVVTAAERAAILAEGVAALKAELGPGIVAVLQGSLGATLDGVLARKLDVALSAPPPAATPAVLTPSTP